MVFNIVKVLAGALILTTVHKYFFLTLGFFYSVTGFSRCGKPAQHISLLQWSRDGDSALLLGRFATYTDFFLIDGASGKITTFHFDKNGRSEYVDGPNGKLKLAKESNDVSVEECENSMHGLNLALEKNRFAKLPMVDHPCRKKGSRFPSNEDLGPYIGVITGTLVSAKGTLKFESSSTPDDLMCGGNKVTVLHRERKSASDFLKIQQW